jgi:hypothetical protein
MTLEPSGLCMRLGDGCVDPRLKIGRGGMGSGPQPQEKLDVAGPASQR